MASLGFEVNLSILFTELPLLERPVAAKQAGFDAVEFRWPWPVAVPSDAEVAEFATAVTDAGVQLVGLNFFAGDMPGGDRGLVSWPARSAEFRDNIDVTIGLGERLGCRAFNALYGNRTDDAAPEEQDTLGAENLALAARAAQRIGATVLVEPVSGAPRYPLLTAVDALGAIDRAGEENIRLLLDVYHLAVNGDDVDAAIERAAGRIGHVQIADAPGRNEPGTGKLPIDSWLDRIAATGYDGWVGLECKPSGASAEIEGGFVQGAGWLTLEDLRWEDRDGPRRGMLATHAASTYKLPSFSEMPEVFNVTLLEKAAEDGVVYGGKAVGEPPLMLAFSVREALRQAAAAFGPPGTSVDLACPATPEAVYWAVEQARRASDPVRGEHGHVDEGSPGRVPDQPDPEAPRMEPESERVQHGLART